MYPPDPRFDASRRVPSGFDMGRWQALEQATPDALPWKLLPHTVKRSSQDRPWPGLLFWHQVGPEGDLYVPPTASHTILVRRAQPTQLLQRQGSVIESLRWQPGQAVVVPAGLPSFWRSALPRDNLHIDLSPAWLERVAHAQVSLQSCFGRDDPLLAGFAQLLLASLDSNTSLDSQFGQHIAEAIALHLMQHYVGARASSRAQAGLSRRQMQRVEEALRTDLAGHWTVERLAQLVDLSPFHFSRAFRASFGAAPHAWLRLQRMEAAAHAVRETRLSFEEIARQTGHRSASHFAQAFRQHWGMTPTAYRRAA